MDKSKEAKCINFCAKIAAHLLNTDPDVISLLKKGIDRRPELWEPWLDNGRDRKRIVLSFLLEHMATTGLKGVDDYTAVTKKFGKLKTVEKIKYAKDVLDENPLSLYVKQARSNKKYARISKRDRSNRWENSLDMF